MNYSAIPASVRYQSDGTSCAWPIPFPFGGPADVGCNMQDRDGNDRELVYGSDYLIKDNCVMAVVPAGCSIAIWLNRPIGDAIAGARDKAMAQDDIAVSPANAGGAASPAAAPGNSEELAQLAAEVRSLKAVQENALTQARLAEEDRQVQRIAAEGDKAAGLVAERASQTAQSLNELLAGAAGASLEEIRTASLGAANEAEEARRKALEAQAAANEAIERLNAARAAFDSEIASARKALADAEEQSLQSLSMLAENAGMTLAAAEQDAAQRIRRDSDLYQGCVNQEGFFTQTAAWKSGSVIPLPNGITYYPGRYMLRITHNGQTLVQGVQYQEVANVVEPGAPSGDIRILFDSAAGSLWSFWVVAANAGSQAINAAAEAEAARRKAEEWAARARDYASGVEAVRDETNRIGIQAQANLEGTGKEYDARLTAIKRDAWNIGQEAAANLDAKGAAHAENLRNIGARIESEGRDWSARLADETAVHSSHLWQFEQRAAEQAANARESAADAWDMAVTAWQHAWQASMQSLRPGIAAIRKADEVFGCSSGVYIVNPCISTSPTIFMGVWPVDSVDDIKFDGIFFIGPQYPDVPNPPPPPKPDNPADRPNTGGDTAATSGKPVEWGPCIHHKQ